MTSRPNADIAAKQPASRKRGGHELGALYYPRSAAKWDKAHQRSAKRHIVPLWEEALA